MTTRIEPERVRCLRDDEPADGRFVLYWMQAAQRAEHNPALEFAIQRANEHGIPLVVLAVVITDYPEANQRHFAFMLGGLRHALRAIDRRGARTCVRIGDPVDAVAELADGAVEVILDRGYLRHQRNWYDSIVDRVPRRVTQVEGEVVVPVAVASDRQESAARTIRPKINRERDRFLVALDTTPLDVTTTPRGTTSELDLLRDVDDEHAELLRLLDELGLAGGRTREADDGDRPLPVTEPLPGTAAARAALDRFLDGISDYDDRRNRYNDDDGSSHLSPYLHFGQISPVHVAVEAVDRAGDDAEPFLEELIVRRELAVNYVLHQPDYDRFAGLPGWARDTLADHAGDERDDVYTAAELERGETDDPVWNAIMGEIRRRGRVHNQLRMYWGKQFVRWTNTPEHAYRTLLEINDRWFLDGRDPNSFANVGWCFGVHDRPFQERAVSGKLRPFTTAALKRKDDLARWVDDHPPH